MNYLIRPRAIARVIDLGYQGIRLYYHYFGIQLYTNQLSDFAEKLWLDSKPTVTRTDCVTVESGLQQTTYAEQLCQEDSLLFLLWSHLKPVFC